MKHIILIVLLGMLCSLAISQENTMPGMEEMMKKMAEASTPGPMHKKLNMFAGSWNVKSSLWME
jgi:predicted small secreted protein